jgi:hypothetical protein
MATCILWGTCPMKKVACKYRVKRGAVPDRAANAQLVTEAFYQGLMSGTRMGVCVVMGGTPSKGTPKDGRLAASQGSKKSSGGKAAGGKSTAKGASGKSGGKPTPPWMRKGSS